jgi:DNA polymerase-3 subunit alpha
MAFVHLHVHTQYSLLQGAIRMESFFDRLETLGMTSVAITDTHNLFGAIDFYQEALKRKIKPILGCEIIYAPSGVHSFQKGQNVCFHHLVLLCKNLLGYQNLCQMLTRSYRESSYSQKAPASFPKAWIDRALLDKYGDGLVILSGCLRGELPYFALNQNESAARDTLIWFKKRFGENFFLELQDSDLPEQQLVNETLSQWSKRYEVACVATSDCHYLDPQDAEAHEVLQCIEHGRNLDVDRAKSLVPPQYYLKSEAEMRARFERFPEACDSTNWISDRCHVEFQFKDSEGRTIYHLPAFFPQEISEESRDSFDVHSYLKDQAHLGLKKRFLQADFKKRELLNVNLKDEYLERLNSELEMIIRVGFSGYFLIVADFINWAKKNKIPVGPGRGSGAGSLVAYALSITDIDSIRFQLLFERFINPERISLPDFDVDFCQDKRDQVIDYVSKRYGPENVCQIITFGKLQARAVVRDVGRVLGFSFSETDQITKLLPDVLDITLTRALQMEPRLVEKIKSDPGLERLMKYACSLEGLYRNPGVHAAGVIITEKPVVTYCPLFMGREGYLVTQFDKDFAESIGLVKFDFLGLKTLTVIDQTIQFIPDFVLEDMDYEDPEVFRLMSSGDTDGVFQLESSGMKDLCIRIQPNSLEDVAAINALYRPGPLGSGMVDDFIDRKHGRKMMTYEVPALEPILKETYGVILYQEQVMQIARELAGYSLGQADLLRRAMGKKKPEEMAKHSEIFVQGAVKKGLIASQAQSIFDLMAKFAEYGFNKSHSTAYGVLTYQTAYLKTHYFVEFMAALMTTEMDNTDKLTKYIHDAKKHAISVLTPDVNASQKKFSVEMLGEKKALRFGLEAIKGVGSIAVDAILEARKKGVFKSVLDLCQRVSTRKLNKKVIEALCLAGALDSIAEVNRASLFASLEKLLEYASDEQAEKELGQTSFFDAVDSEQIKAILPVQSLYKQEPEWPASRKLSLEKEVVGFYVSGHPMDLWQSVAEQWLNFNTQKLKSGVLGDQVALKRHVRIGGILSELNEITTKKGSRMAFVQLEDLRGKVEVIFFPETFLKFQEFLKKAILEAEPVLLEGDWEVQAEPAKIIVKKCDWLALAHRNRVGKLLIRLQPSEVNQAQLRELKQQIIQSRGKCPVCLDFEDPSFRTQLSLSEDFRVSPSASLIQAINRIFSKEVVFFQESFEQKS